MAANARFYKVYPVEIAYFTNKIRSIAYAGRDYSYVSEQTFNGGIVINLKHGVSLSSWGENIRVCLTAQGDQTVVDIYSECVMPTQVIAWGKNQENVQFIFMYLEQGMPMQQYNPYQQPYQQPVYQQPYAQQPYAQQPYAQQPYTQQPYAQAPQQEPYAPPTVQPEQAPYEQQDVPASAAEPLSEQPPVEQPLGEQPAPVQEPVEQPPEPSENAEAENDMLNMDITNE